MTNSKEDEMILRSYIKVSQQNTKKFAELMGSDSDIPEYYHCSNCHIKIDGIEIYHGDYVFCSKSCEKKFIGSLLLRNEIERQISILLYKEDIIDRKIEDLRQLLYNKSITPIYNTNLGIVIGYRDNDKDTAF